MKKRLIAVLALSLVSVFAFANGNGEGGKKVFTSFIGESRPAMPADGTIIGNKIEELTGVKVEMEYLVGDLRTKAGIMLASGDLPDFINARNEHYRFRSDGYLIPLEDLIEEHAPNIKRVIGDSWDSYFQDGPDGEGSHIYAIPDLITYGTTTATRPDNAWYIQKIVLAEAGWPEVKTFDQYWKLIEDYKAKNPTINGEETIGFELNTFDWYKWYVFEAAHEAMSGHLDSQFRVDRDENGNWTIDEFYFKDDVKKYFREMNKMYNKGLINPEGFVNTLDQYLESMASGRVLGTYQPAWVFQSAMDLVSSTMPERSYVGLPLAWNEGDYTQYNETRSPAVGMGTSISTSCKDPVGAIKYLDALLTDEIQMLGYWGVEGEDYYRNEEGRVTRTKEQNKKFSDRSNDYFYPVWGGEYYNEFWPAIDGTFDDGTATRSGSQPEIFYQDLDDVEKEILDNMGWDTFNSAFTQPGDPRIADRGVYTPLWNMTPDTGTIEQQFSITLTQGGVRDGYIPQMIMAPDADAFEKVWQEYKAHIESMEGREEYNAYIQAEIDKRAGQTR